MNHLATGQFDSPLVYAGVKRASLMPFLAEDDSEPRPFAIRAADSNGHRSSANILIKRRYAWRGYDNASLPADESANRITLIASDHEETIGTLTIGLDSDEGLFVGEVFGDHVQRLRAEGRRLCEFSKLAMDPILGSKRVLASLFHVAYLIAHRMRGYDTLVIEVNPRHVAYYRRMLGATVLEKERMNSRVNAPAVLLTLDLNYSREQIARFGGKADTERSERTFYPYFFSPQEEAGLLARLQKSRWARPSSALSPVEPFKTMPTVPVHQLKVA
jgi:hypothetical protein